MDAVPSPHAQKAAFSFAELRDGAVTGPFVSDWVAVDQGATTAFGQLTLDPDPNHIDADWARAQGAFGGPIAFGFQTLAMLTWLLKSAGGQPGDATHVVNYGFDRVRFTATVPVGALIRGEFRVAEVRRRSDVQVVVSYEVTVRVEGAERPALQAVWLALYEGPGRDG